MQEFKQFIKTSLIYFLGNFSSKFIGILMLPIYTRYLMPQEYGKYDLYMTYVSFFMVVCFLDSGLCAMKFMLDSNYKNIANYKEKIIFGAFVISVICAVLFILIFNLFLNFMDTQIVSSLVILGFLSYLFNSFYCYICRAYGLNGVFVFSGILSSALVAIFSTIFLIIFKFNYNGIIYASILSLFITIIFMESKLHLISKIKLLFWDFGFVKAMFLYSLPLISLPVSFELANFYAKFCISTQLGFSQNGYYAIATKFSLILFIFMFCFKMAWQELSFAKELEKKQMSMYFSQILNEYIKFLLICAVFLLFSVKIIFPFFVDELYFKAIVYIPVAVFSVICIGVYEFLIVIINKINYNKFLPKITIIYTIINILFITFTIKYLELFSVFFAFILQYIVACVMIVLLVKKEFLIKFYILNMIYLFLFILQSYLFINFSIFINFVFIIFFIIFTIFIYKDKIVILKDFVCKR